MSNSTGCDGGCSFCQSILTKSFSFVDDGTSIVFNVVIDAIAVGYIFSALYLLFRIQRSYTYLQQSSTQLNSSGSTIPMRTMNGDKKQLQQSGDGNNQYVAINMSSESQLLFDKNMRITINQPKIIGSTYFRHLLFVIIWLSVMGLILMLMPPWSGILYPTLIIVVGSGQIITDNWILVFLSGKGDDKFASRCAFFLCTLLYLIITSTSLASTLDSPLCTSPQQCQLFLFQDPYTRLGMHAVYTVVYGVLLFLSVRGKMIRPTARIWITFLLIEYFISSLGSFLKILHVDFSDCLLSLSSITYAFLYGPLLFRTCGNDTNLLRARSEFEPLLNNFQEYQNLFGGESITSSDGTNALQLAAFNIKYSEFKFGEVIGGGYFGEVKKAIWKGALVAVKVLHRNSYRNTDNIEDNVFFKEVAILSILRHPNVLQFLGVCAEQDKNCIVTEYMGGGSLDRLISDRYFLFLNHPEFAWRIALDIAKGMFYLHDWKPNPILHRDLSTKNILLDETFSLAKVADFGLSREQGFEMTASVGYLPFQAPEVFIGELYTPKADVYSFGILLWCIVSGEQPTGELPPLKMAHMAAYENYRPPLPDLKIQMWQPLVNLIQMCWKPNPEERPTFAFVLDFLEANMPAEASTFFQRTTLTTTNGNSTRSASLAMSVALDTTSSSDDDDIFNRNEFHYIGD
ncbi:putative transmembrane protein [Heterostelium album PN500]|uniref:Putative transmembrane protein n=1 Tax=Heterostelium pallidum (strain ATCC 26659 / Pp 5 / PN500) TaxID=670386 RepID=D3BNF5_HETP5|nr:putative transmembrane protein [Heterostelium album PN500]EFA76815.1 putative transmembrane protein [Heterostelium album PN500]|eukprot:XP_020428947.1 putative transmembrane protein [Heterostelium album PN500]